MTGYTSIFSELKLKVIKLSKSIELQETSNVTNVYYEGREPQNNTALQVAEPTRTKKRLNY